MMVQFEADEVNANVMYGIFQGEGRGWDSNRVFLYERSVCTGCSNELLFALLHGAGDIAVRLVGLDPGDAAVDVPG